MVAFRSATPRQRLYLKRVPVRVEERLEYPVQHPAKVEDLLKLPLAGNFGRAGVPHLSALTKPLIKFDLVPPASSAKGDDVVRWRNAARLNDLVMLRKMIEDGPDGDDDEEGQPLDGAGGAGIGGGGGGGNGIGSGAGLGQPTVDSDVSADGSDGASNASMALIFNLDDSGSPGENFSWPVSSFLKQKNSVKI